MGHQPTAVRQEVAIEAGIELERPRIEMTAAAHKDSVPLVRQALRALGSVAGADPEALRDAELAVTEACTNAVRHAYGSHPGTIDVTIEIDGDQLLTTVRDHGRGMSWTERRPPTPGRSGGLGLTVIESVTADVLIRSARGKGTEVAMTLLVPGVSEQHLDEPEGSTVERVVRRLVAMVGAQADLSPAQVAEMLFASELVARQLPFHVTGDRVELRIEHTSDAIEVALGPLRHGGPEAILDNTDLPGLGPVIPRLARRTRTLAGANGLELCVEFSARPQR